MADLSRINTLFYPKSIAVVGASAKEGSVGNDVVKNLKATFKGDIYPINPKAPEICGLKAYTSVLEVPGDVELAVISVAAKFVLGVVDQCIEKGVKALVCITAGFKEIGGEGVELEKQFQAKVKAANIALVGPNCLGVINAESDACYNASFANQTPMSGSLAFVSQSGALCTSVLDFAAQREMGFSKFVSFGNKADVNEVDLLNYLAEDDKTKVVAMYLEAIGDGEGFTKAVRKLLWEKNKPVLILKSGRSAAGAKAVSSHTGSLAGNDAVYEALLKQSGAIRVDSIEQLFDYAALFCNQPLPKGNRLAIITNAGGPGIMATDASERVGLTLAALSDETKAALREKLPEAASVRNPVDVLGDAKHDRYADAVTTVMADPDVDMGLVILTPQSMTDTDEIGKIIPEVAKTLGKPVVCAFMGAESVKVGAANLRAGGIPNYAFPENAIGALAAGYNLTQTIAQSADNSTPTISGAESAKCAELIKEKLGDKDSVYLTQAEARPLFACYGMPLLKSAVVKSADEAAATVGEWGVTVVMKVMSDDVKHKFDAGGVLLNITGADAAREGYNKIYENIAKNVPGAKIDSILIEQMAAKGTEVILGCNRDAKFGPLVMFGMGGTTAELMKDVQFRLAPMSQYWIHSMLENTKVYKLMNNYRGLGQHDLAALEDALTRLSVMVAENPEIAELDINPLIVHAEGQGCSLADSRIVLKKVK